MEGYIEEDGEVKIFHGCTRGYGGVTLFFDKQDFITAVNYTAIVQYKSNVGVVAFCHMPNHSHFIISSDKQDAAQDFLTTFKRLYSMYFRKKHNGIQIFRKEDDLIKRIDNPMYLRQCIAYVLRNPLKAGLVKTMSSYPWTSFSCYFPQKKTVPSGTPVCSIPYKKARKILRTHIDLRGSKLYISENGMITPESFVYHKMAEDAFNNSLRQFLSYFGSTDDEKLEYDLIISAIVKYNISEIEEIAENLSKKDFGKKVEMLLPEQRRKLAIKIHKKYNTTVARLARVLKINKGLIADLEDGRSKEK